MRRLLIAVEQNGVRRLSSRVSIAAMRSKGSNDRGGPYNRKRWRRRRRRQLAQQPLCEFCLDKGLTIPADVVDHIEEHHGDHMKFWYGALRSLCRPCHERRHGRAPGGKRPWIGTDGWPLEPAQQAEQEAIDDVEREFYL